MLDAVLMKRARGLKTLKLLCTDRNLLTAAVNLQLNSLSIKIFCNPTFIILKDGSGGQEDKGLSMQSTPIGNHFQ